MNRDDNRRILLVDDNDDIHEVFRRILTGEHARAKRLENDPAHVLHRVDAETAPEHPVFEVTSARQGQEAVKIVADACVEELPFALAFVDMRMPPGWDGLTTIKRLWDVDPELLVVICTAHTDYSWNEISATLGTSDRWLVLKKPCERIEVQQTAIALAEKWNLARFAREREVGLEVAVWERTEQLRRTSRVKNEFLANVSHELLTPMNGIAGMQELLATTNLDREQREMLEDARNCTNQLLQILRQVIAYNQAEAGTLALEPVEFEPVAFLEELADGHRARAEHKGLALAIRNTTELPAKLRAPVPVIREIFRVLLDNAVKFTSSGSVELGMHVSRGRLLCTVSDTGPGMSPEQVRFIMEPFAQLDGGMTRNSTGFGLGLALARRLVESLGGKLHISSTPDSGTTAAFSTLLPRAALVSAG